MTFFLAKGCIHTRVPGVSGPPKLLKHLRTLGAATLNHGNAVPVHWRVDALTRMYAFANCTLFTTQAL